MKRTES